MWVLYFRFWDVTTFNFYSDIFPYILCHFANYVCSVQSENLRNLEIAFYILRILRLCSNLKINLDIAH